MHKMVIGHTVTLGLNLAVYSVLSAYIVYCLFSCLSF